jgi:glutaredoxin 2
MMTLYVYDHCPYCVRVRIPFGFKGIDYDLVTMLNDDIETPTNLVGKKIVPILTMEDGTHMPESMDIVRYIDQLDGKPMFAGSTDLPELQAWISQYHRLTSRLLIPRCVRAPFAEFATQGGIDYFTKAKQLGSFDDVLAVAPQERAEMSAGLAELEGLLHSATSAGPSLSAVDIDLFGKLRGITLVKGLVYPPKVRAYLEYMSERSDVPLLDEFAEA